MKLNFTIPEVPRHLQTHQVIDLCDYLTVKVLDPMFAQNGVKWDHRFTDFFHVDNSCDPLEPTGTIRFAVPPMFVGQLGQLENAITEELTKLQIKAAPFAYEGVSGITLRPTIVISIVDNPTVLVEPPAVNMSSTRGRVVLRDLLGYKTVNGRYEFATDDLLQRVSSVTEEKIAACTASPVRDTKAPGGVRRAPSPVSMKAVRRCLEEVQLFAQWALSHNYRRLAAV
jgi:hypothetical protein